jgi:hypothetical protein
LVNSPRAGSDLSYRGLRIVVAPEEASPFDPDARVLEEDTFLVLSADRAIREPVEHPIRILTQAHEYEPQPPGTVVVREGKPLLLLAVVHDLGQDPTWSEEWIGSALQGVFQEANRRRLRRLALAPLGTVHGRLRHPRFAELLHEALDRTRPEHLAQLWIVAPRDAIVPLVARLACHSST